MKNSTTTITNNQTLEQEFIQHAVKKLQDCYTVAELEEIFEGSM